MWQVSIFFIEPEPKLELETQKNFVRVWRRTLFREQNGWERHVHKTHVNGCKKIYKTWKQGVRKQWTNMMSQNSWNATFFVYYCRLSVKFVCMVVYWYLSKFMLIQSCKKRKEIYDQKHPYHQFWYLIVTSLSWIYRDSSSTAELIEKFCMRHLLMKNLVSIVGIRLKNKKSLGKKNHKFLQLLRTSWFQLQIWKIKIINKLI